MTASNEPARRRRLECAYWAWPVRSAMSLAFSFSFKVWFITFPSKRKKRDFITFQFVKKNLANDGVHSSQRAKTIISDGTSLYSCTTSDWSTAPWSPHSMMAEMKMKQSFTASRPVHEQHHTPDPRVDVRPESVSARVLPPLRRRPARPLAVLSTLYSIIYLALVASNLRAWVWKAIVENIIHWFIVKNK